MADLSDEPKNLGDRLRDLARELEMDCGYKAAWHSVVDELKTNNPKFMETDSSGVGCALREIRRLQAIERRVRHAIEVTE